MVVGHEVWKSPSVVRMFLEGVRGGIPFAAAQIDVMLRVIDAASLPIRHFADLGCGDGTLAAAILERHREARGVLVDHSEPMVRAARERLAGFSDRIELRVVDLARSSWSEGVERPLDAVVSGFAIHHLADARKRELYGEIFAILAGGGVFVNVEHVASATAWVAQIADDHFIDSLHAFHAAQGSTKTRDDVAPEYVNRPDKEANILAPLDRQCEWLRAIGFSDVDCYFKSFELAVFGGRRPR